jgi:hypothetical protein
MKLPRSVPRRRSTVRLDSAIDLPPTGIIFVSGFAPCQAPALADGGPFERSEHHFLALPTRLTVAARPIGRRRSTTPSLATQPGGYPMYVQYTVACAGSLVVATIPIPPISTANNPRAIFVTTTSSLLLLVARPRAAVDRRRKVYASARSLPLAFRRTACADVSTKPRYRSSRSAHAMGDEWSGTGHLVNHALTQSSCTGSLVAPLNGSRIR